MLVLVLVFARVNIESRYINVDVTASDPKFEIKEQRDDGFDNGDGDVSGGGGDDEKMVMWRPTTGRIYKKGAAQIIRVRYCAVLKSEIGCLGYSGR